MANNGYLLNDSCVTDVQYAISLVNSDPVCKTYSGLQTLYYYPLRQVACTSSNGGWRSLSSSIGAPVCEIPGPPLTETQQIEAINALFPSAIAILAIAWGFKYIRVLVAEWLKERNASD